MTVKKISLQNFISREFFKAALLPLFIIEIALLALYFLMNTYILDKSVKTLRKDRLSHLLEMSDLKKATTQFEHIFLTYHLNKNAMSMKKVAAALGLSSDALRTKLNRLKKKLQ